MMAFKRFVSTALVAALSILSLWHYKILAADNVEQTKTLYSSSTEGDALLPSQTSSIDDGIESSTGVASDDSLINTAKSLETAADLLKSNIKAATTMNGGGMLAATHEIERNKASGIASKDKQPASTGQEQAAAMLSKKNRIFTLARNKIGGDAYNSLDYDVPDYLTMPRSDLQNVDIIKVKDQLLHFLPGASWYRLPFSPQIFLNASNVCNTTWVGFRIFVKVDDGHYKFASSIPLQELSLDLTFDELRINFQRIELLDYVYNALLWTDVHRAMFKVSGILMTHNQTLRDLMQAADLTPTSEVVVDVHLVPNDNWFERRLLEYHSVTLKLEYKQMIEHWKKRQEEIYKQIVKDADGFNYKLSDTIIKSPAQLSVHNLYNLYHNDIKHKYLNENVRRMVALSVNGWIHEIFKEQNLITAKQSECELAEQVFAAKGKTVIKKKTYQKG